MDPAQHARHTREVYDRLAPVWSATTDDGPFNGLLERPALRSLVPRPLKGRAVLDVGCGSGAQCAWLLDEGAHVTGVDLSPMMIEQARRRCGSRANLLVADMAESLPFEPQSFDGVTCSLALHYLRDWQVPLASFARVLRPGGWAVISLDHPFGAPLPDQRDGYFQRQLVSDTWSKADVEVTQHFWRRPLAQVVDAFAEAGFVVERIAEPQPSPEAMLRYPAALQNVVDSPSFIVYRLLLVG
ncbi:class I SAM-dependent methyltransferase [Mycobacteroides salmoniphilum]|uniref:class I SAM-dependent methyltransferase n=1 Tax=Mycobacteroides salmoniphilum TaxID=404941 RepID=UPI001067134A|nr:class I SAM-dependent methyltransferase [Mycobacteroides salmoniphilum]TDZ89500.1 Demethylmenaquinone methyltransferase [Mycobacteroides salmoniphilum]